MGPPGSGKNTQMDFVSDQYDLGKFDMGETLRSAIANDEVGEEGKALMRNGIMLPANIIIPMAIKGIEKALEENPRGIVTSGVPRTPDQAFGEDGLIDWIDQNLQDAQIQFINLVISEHQAMERNFSRKDGRVDDDPNVAKNRIKEFQTKMVPIINQLKEGDYDVIDIDATPDIKTVSQSIKDALDGQSN